MKKGGKGATSKNAPMKRHAKTTVPALAMPQYVEGDLRFYVTDGTYISSYKELAKTLDAMHITIFSFHVNQQKNDFRNWVADCFKDAGLAKRIEKAKTPKEMAKVVKERIANLEKQA
ncbi:hypothetical protein J4460_02960 [Candidatus Woesearchaeota archaeon]|nr:MAG: hypothetical protein QS99_C0006G0014 [archaeon GW2011_AR4]MBS3129607.1 hypothetical protein [Candidatus Woesearchaeota archaeon]HIH37684.1 hypothetical protein [Candidatus Woesearchaeota archaeon]HIH49066.1 hypothetical protein [Candidatus Woesearchaeota archaeon]HIJ02917.1 hypothetical protein [Candidatus Woesearchaeota archaeon]